MTNDRRFAGVFRGFVSFAVVCLPLAALVFLVSPAQDKKQDSAPARFVEITPQAQSTIERGLHWLSKNQARNGSFGNGNAPVATTAICGLSFLAGGHIPGRSKYGENVEKALEFLAVRCASKQGYINEGGMRGMGGSGMHGHGYALMFLAEAYGMSDAIPTIDTKKLKDVITRAVRVTEQAQAANGGWTYDPTPGGDEGSVTVTQVQALRAARNAGIAVNQKTIDKAVEYINTTTDNNGMTHYSLGAWGSASFALTAAGMSVLNYLGQYDNPKIEQGLKYCMQNKPGTGGARNNYYHFYGNYYATVAFYQAGGRQWEEWFTAVRDELVKTQASDGSWPQGESGSYGKAFGSGFALLMLQMPYRYLPMFQRAQD